MASPEYDRWMALGRARQEAGRLFDAMICFRNAGRADGANADAPERLGEVLWLLGRAEDAAAAWREAVRRDGQARAPALALAAVLLALGDAAGARAVAGDVLPGGVDMGAEIRVRFQNNRPVCAHPPGFIIASLFHTVRSSMSPETIDLMHQSWGHGKEE